MTHLCPVDRCPGHIHPGWAICRPCAAALKQNLAELPWLASELAIQKARLTSHSHGRPSNDIDQPLPYDTFADERSQLLRATLVSWVRELEPNPTHHPDDTLTAVSQWLYAHHGQLIVHPAAEEACGEIRYAIGQAQAALQRRHGTRFQLPDPCPECGAELMADMHDVDDPRPNAIWCLGEDGHIWEPHQWLRLGHRLGYGRESA